MPEPHNTIVLDLLLCLSQWHALAKLRMHHEGTLAMLESTTVLLASQFRKFQLQTCDVIKTMELPKETEARSRQAAAKASAKDQNGAQAQVRGGGEASKSGQRAKTFNIATYKYHALADYANTIRQFGTTDSYTTEIVSVRSQVFGYSCADLPEREGRTSTPKSQKLVQKDRQAQLPPSNRAH